MEETEAEHQRDPPRMKIASDQVLDGDVGDRQGDQRLDHGRRHRYGTVQRQSERKGVGRGERGDLYEHGPQRCGEQNDAEHEQDVVEPAGEDVGIAQLQILGDHLQRGLHGEAVQNEPCAALARQHPAGNRRAVTGGQGHRILIGDEAVGELDARRPGRDGARQTEDAGFGQFGRRRRIM